jgi:hypothetical protein
MLLGAAPIAGALVESGEAGVAMADQRPQRPRLGEGERLAVPRLGGVDVERCRPAGDRRRDPQRRRLEGALAAVAGDTAPRPA